LSEIIRGLGILLAFVVGGIMMFRMFKPFFLNTKLWFAGSIVINDKQKQEKTNMKLHNKLGDV